MTQNMELLTNAAKAVLLLRIAHELTVCARDTYEVGTENVLQPQVLRAYNELLHRVTASARDHVLQVPGIPLRGILDMINDFGVRYNRLSDVNWALERASQKTLP